MAKEHNEPLRGKERTTALETAARSDGMRDRIVMAGREAMAMISGWLSACWHQKKARVGINC